MEVTVNNPIQCNGLYSHTNTQIHRQKSFSVRWDCQFDKWHFRTANDRTAFNCQILIYFLLPYLKHRKRITKSTSYLLYIQLSLHKTPSALRPVYITAVPTIPLIHSHCTSNCRFKTPSKPLELLYNQISKHNSHSVTRPVYLTVAPQLSQSQSPWTSNYRSKIPS